MTSPDLWTVIVTPHSIQTLRPRGAQAWDYSGPREDKLLDRALDLVRKGDAVVIVIDPELERLLRSEPHTFREVTPKGGAAEFERATQ